jgi:cation diffusion facilitator CzcD-associated flavoprotein CzcO
MRYDNLGDACQLVIGHEEVTLAWRSPFGVAEDRNLEREEYARIALDWRLPSEATEDRNSMTQPGVRHTDVLAGRPPG